MTFDSYFFLKPVSRFASVFFRFAFSLAEVQTFAHLLKKKTVNFLPHLLFTKVSQVMAHLHNLT